MLDVALAFGSVGRLGIATIVAATLHVTLVLSAAHAPSGLGLDRRMLEQQAQWLDVHVVEPEMSEHPASAAAEPTVAPSPGPPASTPARSSRLSAHTPAPSSNLVATDASSDVVTAPSGDDSPGQSASSLPSAGSATKGVAPRSLGHGSGAGSGQGARLLASGDPCPGYFPASSTAARGTVRLAVEVDAHGLVGTSRILSVQPDHAGFSQAALACASRLRFKAATDQDGRPLRTTTTLVLHFQRP